MGISAYGGGVLSVYFSRRCSPDYFFRNVNKMVAWIPDNKKRLFNNRQLLLDMKKKACIVDIKKNSGKNT